MYLFCLPKHKSKPKADPRNISKLEMDLVCMHDASASASASASA